MNILLACLILPAIVLMLSAPALGQASHAAVRSAGFIYETAPYPPCHASTIVEMRLGELAAAWFGGTRERDPDVCIWVARHQNGKWQEAVQAADGVQADGTRLPT